MKNPGKVITSNKRSNRRLFFLLSIFAFLGMAGPLLWLAVTHLQVDKPVASANQPEADEPARLLTDFGRVPLSFEANQGQTAAEVQFLSRGPGYTLFLTPTHTVLSLKQPKKESREGSVSNILRMELMGANPTATVEGRDRLAGTTNYFIGNDPQKWKVDVPNFAKVSYAEIYNGIDLVYYGNQRQLEYDFVVAPNSDASQIRWAASAEKAAIDAEGGLVMTINGSDVQMKKPVAYQTMDGERIEIAANYEIRNPQSAIRNQTIGFTLGEYDHSQPLVIDPVLVYSTFLGGPSQDAGLGIAVDPSGSAYLTGEAGSATFPNLNSTQPFGGGGQDAFVTKFNPTGTALVYSTFLGGTQGFEHGFDIAVDAGGNAYMVGHTISTDYPTTANAFQTAKPSGSSAENPIVTKLGPTGALVYSTYLGGTQGGRGFGIATDGAGNAYVVGSAQGSVTFPFPTTASAFLAGTGGTGFLTKLNTNASGAASLSYSTLLNNSGGTTEGRAVAVDSAGNAYITGNTTTPSGLASAGAFQTTYGGQFDAYAMKFNTNLSGPASRIYSTYLGGTGQDYGANSVARGCKAIAFDANGNAYITGLTRSTNFPTMNPFQSALGGTADAFLTKLNPTGTALVYSTYFGGTSTSLPDEGRGVAVNIVGNAYLTGYSQSADFPVSNPVTPVSTNGGVFLAKFTPAGNALVYSTRLGTTASQDDGNGVALDGAGNAFVTGDARNGYPITTGVFQATPAGITDAFATQVADPTIIGRVVDEDGNPISGAVLTVAGAPAGSAVSDSNGYYTFGLLTAANNYTVSVSVPNYIFTPQVISNLTKNVRRDFSPVVYNISGQVIRCGAPQSGVTMTLTDGKGLVRTTDSSGNYAYANLPAGRNYTVTPSQTDFTFTPASRQVTSLSADMTGNFVVNPPPFATVNGKVLTSDGRGLRNATVSITNSQGATLTATTSSFGFYTFDNMPTGETYTLRISSRLFRFAAQTKQVDCNQTLPDFVGLE